MIAAVASPSITLGALDALPPAVRRRVRELVAALPTDGGALDGGVADRLTRLLDDGEPWLGAAPCLCDVGYWMLEPRHAVEVRQQACVWLTMFPTLETIRRVAAVATDATTPEPVREQAIWTLGYRQARFQHPSVVWAADAVQLADDTLARLADAATTAGKIGGEKLPHALRHVQSDVLAAVFARAPGLWGEALECFATPAVARVLLVRFDELPPQHRLRTIRLIAATLGEEALPHLRARATHTGLDEQLELRLLAVSLGGEAELPALEGLRRGMKFADLLRQRARWHLAHRGVVPTVRGLRVARVTATRPLAERAAACAQAADDLGVLTRFARHPEAYLYTLWGWMVNGAKDPARARTLVDAYPEAQALVRDLYLEDLARRGRVKQLTAAAQTLQGSDLGALWLAIHGRPFAALELAATARLHTPELVCARALACYRAGRPDLTLRVLAEDLPPAELVDEERPTTGSRVDDPTLLTFPGAHERWLAEHAPTASPAIVALAGGLTKILALARPAPTDAEPDTASLEPTAAVVRRLGRGLPGSTVYLAGEFKYLDKDAIARAVEAAGARLVSGPFPGTDYYVHGDWCLVTTIAQLERQGARRLRRGELEGI
jgi:hypothetical protein